MSNNTIDNNLYDRQIRTYGIEAVQKMNTSSVLIHGLAKGLGTEIAKNLALGGIKNIYLYDNDIVSEDDLETGFYYDKTNIGMPRSLALYQKIQELNPYINVKPVDDICQGQHVTIVINAKMNTLHEVSSYTNLSKTKLIVLWSGGFSGTIFVDAGNEHIVLDKTGENIEPVQIANISDKGFVTCAPNTSHDFQSGDTICFTNLEGNNIDFLDKEWEIKVNNKLSFQLLEFPEQNFAFINGTAIHIMKPVTIKHMPFDVQVKTPTLAFSFDEGKSKTIVQKFIEYFSGNIEDYLLSFEFIPVVSIMGSFAASEVIKLVTNKYMPANQWFTWSDDNLTNLDIIVNCKSAKTSYGKLYGNELEKKLAESKFLLVGSGAIGCEHLKNMAFMGIKNIIITDPDSIEKSNLNRQFLFRSHHIGKMKSMMAKEMIVKLIPDISIDSRLDRVGPDNISFTDNILNSDTIVLNALDNIKARRFMDEQCFKYNRPLFESGTTGTKGNTQVVIPFLTETYSASADPDQEKSFPACTIKSFPNEIQHTIHWAMDMFEFFNRAPSTLNKFMNNNNYMESLSQIEKTIAMEDIHKLYFKYKTHLSITNCIEMAFDMFVENYHYSITKLLDTYKPDHETSPGVKFWSAGKRCPKPIMFDINNIMHIDYIVATSNILANISGLHESCDQKEIIKTFTNYTKEYVEMKEIIAIPKPDIVIKYNPMEFEKDDDTNWHVKWVTSASNMRASNYSIPIASMMETKGIAGRIIPAIATTTSIVSGLVMLEIIKYLLGYNKLDQYRSTFINLAEPILLHSDPMEAPSIMIGGIKMNSWIKFDYKQDSSLGEFKKYYDEMFKTNITMIVIDTAMIYADFLGDDVLEKKLSEIISEFPNRSNISFSLGSDDESLVIPNINVSL